MILVLVLWPPTFPSLFVGGLSTRLQDHQRSSRFSFSFLVKPRSRSQDTGEPCAAYASGTRTRLEELFLDLYPMMSYGKVNKGVYMAIDFEALDLVRGENKSRYYNKKLDGLTQQVASLQELVTDVVKELPEEKKWSFEERLKKIKKGA